MINTIEKYSIKTNIHSIYEMRDFKRAFTTAISENRNGKVLLRLN